MRFAWLRENSANSVSVEQSFTNRLIFVAYNVVWWVPVVLRIFGTIDYGTAFLALFILTLIRAGANLYRNNAPHLVALVRAGEKFPDGEHEMFQDNFWTRDDSKNDEPVESASLACAAPALIHNI
jgi:hypothetical protein